MTNEERKALARERVKRWKEKNPYSVAQQRKRWYQKRRRKVKAGIEVDLWAPVKRAVRVVQETHLDYEDPEINEVHYRPPGVAGSMEPNQKGGHERGDRKTVSSGAQGGLRTAGEGIGRDVESEPGDRGDRIGDENPWAPAVQSDDEAGLLGQGDQGDGDGRTDNEKRTYAKLARLIARKKVEEPRIEWDQSI